MMEGLLLKGIGGFYYVETTDGLYECKARGIFRKEEKSPLVGDRVTITPQEGMKGVIEAIGERRNCFIRPPLANLDALLIVVSTVDPAPNLYIIDNLVALAVHKDVEPVLIVTKTDVEVDEKLRAIYEKAGIRTMTIANGDAQGAEALKGYLAGKISAFTGNSGVGKSTLLNAIDPTLSIETGETSKKLGRGRHTTRHCELYPLASGGYIADTPGFSSLDLRRFEVITKDELQYCFPEFGPYLGRCQFTGCSHTCEKGCAILSAYAEGEIGESRFASYKAMYEAAKTIKEWELKEK